MTDKGLLKAGPRRRMLEFEVLEISAVDRPAQEHAKMTLVKRDKRVGFDKNGADLITSSEAGHQHGVKLYMSDDGFQVWVNYAVGEGENAQGHDHAVVMNADGTVTLAENAGHTHEIAADDLREAMMRHMVTKADDEDTDEDGELAEKSRFSAERRRELADSGMALPDGSFPIETKADLKNAVRAYGRAKEEDRKKVAAHIKRRAKALDAGDLLPTEGELADALNKAADEKAKEETPDMPNTELEKQVEKLTADLAKSNAILALSADARAHYDSLEGDAAEEFLGKSADEQKDVVAKAAAAQDDEDPVVFKSADGIEVRKSDGPTVLALAKKAEASAKEAADLRKKAQEADIAKRAADLNIGGDNNVRQAIVKSLDTIEDEDVRKAAFEAVNAKGVELSKATETVGVSGAVAKDGYSPVEKSDAEGRLEALAKAKSEADGISYAKAYDAVLKTAEGAELYKKAMDE